MNKGELIEAVAKDAGISKALAGKVLDSAIDAITSSLSKGDRVALVGFGTFSVSSRKARSGRNPQTGKEIRIPATKVAKFKAGNKLVQAVK
ncbi:MAG: HU family DNA-binding protein [Deltaproteobacteria bacterium]|jgi:DNA-binding protein HU-beta|nr:MAG: HU family DNA-binding protein [Deltaproteobacteria bacterium]UCH06380.1 MAG: HU family DNA-binding protein [Deltaproteobacteria bacterium]